MNAYKHILAANTGRLLALYDADELSPTYGYGDREFWGWKIKDFSNGTMQGGIHALAAAYRLGIIGNREFVCRTVDAAVSAIPRIASRRGGLVEAYPGEDSFCVTALCAFDVLSAISLLQEELRPDDVTRFLDVVAPLISFITGHDEVHAFISNHIATAVAAVLLWNRLTGASNPRAAELLGRIFERQSPEGWYDEYGGADPGYQTLCTHYLAAAYREAPDDELKSSLERSCAFLEYCIRPDGTLGGLYGSRNTEVYYPGGIVALAGVSPGFARIARRMEQGISGSLHLLPQDIDIGNYVPLLNSYAAAALAYEDNRKRIEASDGRMACDGEFERIFPDAGLFVRSTRHYHCVLNFKKGGTLDVFDKAECSIDVEDGGLYAAMKGRNFTTQQVDRTQKFSEYRIETRFFPAKAQLPTPGTAIVLRLLGISLFRWAWAGELFKKLIVRMMMTGKERGIGRAVRIFEFTDDRIRVRESVRLPAGCGPVGRMGRSRSIHMASSGYLLKRHTVRASVSSLVEFEQV